MNTYGTVFWKTKIPKKLYNKINYNLNKYGSNRADFLDLGIDYLQLKYSYNQDIPDLETLYRLSENDEANLVTWQARVSECEAQGYNQFMSWHDITGRDVLATALYHFM